MLRITAVSAGAVDYLLRGSGCAEHEHAEERGEEAEKADAPGYFLNAMEHGEAPGRWFGNGLEMLGMSAGTNATADDVQKIFGELRHPETDEFLGRPPRRFKDYDARVAAALEREPNATPERVREIREATRLDSRKAVAYFDFTFSPVKSVSVYYTALIAAGAREDAAKVLQAHRDAVTIAMTYLERHGAYVRTGYHGKTADGRSVGAYEAATGINGIAFDHSTNRENEPQLHTHFAVLNRVRTVRDEVVRALDNKGFRPVKEAVATAYERALEDRLTADLGVRFALRPDGKAREIVGIDPQLCAEASTRRAQVEARIDELVEAYVDRHGYEPSAAARKAIAQTATLDTRKAKGAEAGPGALREWGEERAERLVAMLDQVDAAAARIEREGHPDAENLPDQRDRQAILTAAVADVQERYPTWTLGNLVAAIDRQVISLPCTPEPRPDYLEGMAREVLTPGNEYGVLVLTAPDPVEVPASLQRPQDGRFLYRPHMDEKYTTERHLDTERRIVVGARQLTAPAITGPELEMLRVELAASKLTADQAAAVVGIVSSGRAADVLIGPAGTGKSFTVGMLSRVWTEHTGGRVMGLATSQRATDVLGEDGVEAVNTARFLARFTPDPETGEARDQVCPGDMFVVDEAGMAGTDELARICALVEAGGGKLLYTGDHHQLSAVKAGGLLELLAKDNGAYELDTVRRFCAEWEKPASIRLRAGDTSVLAEYDDRGRLLGGTVEEMQAAAMRAYMADILDGLDSLLIVGSNAEAMQMSKDIREQLVDLGKVDSDVLAELRDGNQIGVGDVIQARRNHYGIEVQGGRGMVVNREVYTVRGVDERGRIVAETEDGATAYLPPSYVQEHVSLGYASTIHSAQGRTVDAAHSLLGEQSTREDAYVALTRGRERNVAYLTTQRAPDAHTVERVDVDPVAALAAVMDNSDPSRAAELEYRAGTEEGRSLAWVGGQWDLVAREYAEYRYTDTLVGLLPAEEIDALVAEPGYDRLMRAVRSAELQGHNAERVITEAVRQRELHTADSVTDVLRVRVRRGLDDHVPEQVVDPRNWTTLAAPTDGTVGRFLHELAVLAGDRQTALGERTVDELPEWAVQHLGSPPVEPTQREEWVRRAGIAAAYRDMAAVDGDQVSLGAAPSPEQEFRRALWQQAHTALGNPTDALDFAAASDAELREMRARWDREQTWAPAYVADEMRAAYTVAEGYRQDSVVYSAQLEMMEQGSAEHEATRADVDRAERLAVDYAERARQLEDIHQARQGWFTTTEDARVRAQLAAEELDRRDATAARAAEATAQNETEQLELFRIADEREIGPDPERPAATGQAYADVDRDEEHQAVAEDTAEVEHQPALEAEPVDHVRWWQRWRDRLIGHAEQTEEPTEQTPEVEPGTELPPVEVARVEGAIDRAATADERREQVVQAEPGRELVDDRQPTLFDLPDAARVGAQPLRVETQQLEPDDAELRVSLAEARRQARTADLIREQRTAAEQARAEQRRRTQAERAAEADRARRDQAEERAQVAEQARQAEERHLDQEREPRADEPQIEMVQTPAPNPQPEPGGGRPAGPPG